MIVNTTNPSDSKRYTDEKTAQALTELSTLIESYIADHLDAVIEANGFEGRISDVETSVISAESRLTNVETIVSKSAVSSNITGANSFSVVKYNSDGIVVEGSPLVGGGAVAVDGGTVYHRPSTLAQGTYGGKNKTVEFTVDSAGHITGVNVRDLYVPSTIGTAGQVLRSDGDEYVPETVADTVGEGDSRLVSSGAVYSAIHNAMRDASLYSVKGSCTYDELITKNTARVGDVYNISSGRYAGANFVCILDETIGASAWDKMSETIDLSDYAKQEDLNAYLSGEELTEHMGIAAGVSNWGHAMSSDIIPPASEFSGTGSKGTQENVGVFARADHQHPPQKKVEEATRLSTARRISLTGDVTGNVRFDGSANVSIATTIPLGTVVSGETKPVSGGEVARVIAELESTLERDVSDRELTHTLVQFTIPIGSESGTYDCGNAKVKDTCDIVVYYDDEDTASEGDVKIASVSDGVFAYSVGNPSGITSAINVKCVVLFGNNA